VATLATRSLDSLLFGVRMNDAPTYGAVVTLVAAVVAIASYLPARRAAAAAANPITLLVRD
jgi:hypothetical protein